MEKKVLRDGHSRVVSGVEQKPYRPLRVERRFPLGVLVGTRRRGREYPGKVLSPNENPIVGAVFVVSVDLGNEVTSLRMFEIHAPEGKDAAGNIVEEGIEVFTL